MLRLGSHKEWMGFGETRHLHHFVRVLQANTGEPDRDVKDSGEEAGETRTETSKALQAVSLGIGVGVWESHRQGEGPEE
jgi:hypothetical protein